MSAGQSANPFLEALKTRRKLAFQIFLGVMLMVAAGAFLTLQYSASAVVALDPHSLLKEGKGGTENPVDLAWTALTDKQIQAIIQQFQLDSGITHLRAQNRVFTYVRSNISFHQLAAGGNGIPALLEVSFVGSEPGRAVDVANAIAQSLVQPGPLQPGLAQPGIVQQSPVQPGMAQPVAPAAQPALNPNSKDLADELEKVRTTLQLLSQTKQASAPQQQLQQHLRTDANLQTERNATVVELAAFDQQAAQAAAAAAKTRAVAKARAAAPPPPSPAAVALEQQIRQAQAYLAQLRQRYTDEYPAVEDARQALAGLEDKLHRIPVEKPRPRPVRNPGPTPDQIRIMTARDQVLERQQGLDEAIKVNQSQIGLLRQRIANSNDVNQDYAFEQQRYQALLKQQQAQSNAAARGSVAAAGKAVAAAARAAAAVAGTAGAVAGTAGAVAGTAGAVAGTAGAVAGTAAPRFIILQRAASANASGFAVNPLFWIYGLGAAFLIACFSVFVTEHFNPLNEGDATPRSLHLNN